MPFKDPDAQRRSARAHYEANKDAYKARAIEHRKRQREAIKDLTRTAKDKPCADCGIRYPYYVMQFDHLDEKAFTIGDRNRKSISIARMAAEIERCEVVCANCHAERTHQRGQAYNVTRAGVEPSYQLLHRVPRHDEAPVRSLSGQPFRGSWWSMGRLRLSIWPE